MTKVIASLLFGAAAGLAAGLLLVPREHAHPHGHSHDPRPSAGEERKKAQVTVWGDRFEVFLEYEYVVQAELATFAAHVTDLKTLEPRREGPVTFVLRLGPDAPIEHVESVPDRPGIYPAKLSFPKAGEWALSLRIPADGAESTLEIGRVIVYASKEEARKAPDWGTPEGVTFLKEQQWKVLTKAEPAGKRRLVERLRVPGVVRVRPGAKAAVTTPIDGRLLAAPGRGLPVPGDRVREGQVLALVQPPLAEAAARILEAEAAVARTRIALDQAEAAHERVKKLAAGQARTERELQEAEFSLRSARAAHEAAAAVHGAYLKAGAVRAAGEILVFELRSPISGVVTSVEAASGEHVAEDRTLATILNVETVFLEARIAETDLGRIGALPDASYETPDARGRAVPIQGAGGRAVFLGPEVDPATRTVPLVYEVRNPEGRLRIGMALTIFLETARAEEALAVPESAVVDEDGRAVAFVQVAGETFEKRDLVLGLRDGGFVQVLKGLEPGERVVTVGAYAIRLAAAAGSIPAHGHTH